MTFWKRATCNEYIEKLNELKIQLRVDDPKINSINSLIIVLKGNGNKVYVQHKRDILKLLDTNASLSTNSSVIDEQNISIGTITYDDVTKFEASRKISGNIDTENIIKATCNFITDTSLGTVCGNELKTKSETKTCKCLVHQAQKKHQFSKPEKTKIWEYWFGIDQSACCYGELCKQSVLHIGFGWDASHIIPESNGGTYAPDNVVPMRSPCNKGMKKKGPESIISKEIVKLYSEHKQKQAFKTSNTADIHERLLALRKYSNSELTLSLAFKVAESDEFWKRWSILHESSTGSNVILLSEHNGKIHMVAVPL